MKIKLAVASAVLAVSNLAFSAEKSVIPEAVAYVNQGSNCSIVAIDLKTHQIIDTIPIGPKSEKSCMLNSVVIPKQDRLYAIKSHEHGIDQYVYVYNTKTHDLVSAILLSSPPLKYPLSSIVAHPEGSHVYVSSYGSSFNDTVWDINTKTLRPRPIYMGKRSGPLEMLMSPEGERLYVATRGSYSITVVDTSNESIMGEMKDADGAQMVLSRDGKTLYANWVDVLWAFDTATFQKLWRKSLPMPTGLSFAVSADNKNLYTSPHYPAKLQGIFAINIETLDFKQLNSISDTQWGMVITQDEKLMYVTNYDGGELLAVDMMTGEIKARVSGLGKPETVYLQ
jgi:DNA-binding beta-propeller fold protein YncE